MQNTLRSFLDKHQMTAYKLHKLSGIPQNTIYRLVKDPYTVPSGDVMNKILDTVADGNLNDLLHYEPTQQDNSNKVPK